LSIANHLNEYNKIKSTYLENLIFCAKNISLWNYFIRIMLQNRSRPDFLAMALFSHPKGIVRRHDASAKDGYSWHDTRGHDRPAGT